MDKIEAFLDFSDKDWKSIAIWIVIILILIWVIKSEYADQRCADLAEGICGEGKGRAYYNFAPKEGDTREDLKHKLIETAKYDKKTIHWRRMMAVAIISSFIVSYILLQKFPNAKSVAITTIVIFLLSYVAHMQYQEAVGNPAIEQAERITLFL